jgi:hypothetical protein
MEMKIYAIDLDNKASPPKPMHGNEQKISETNLVPHLSMETSSFQNVSDFQNTGR